jgi:hypothetical protein
MVHSDEDVEGNPIADWLKAREADPRALPDARAALLATGVPAERVDAMPPVQVLVLADYLNYRNYLDRFSALWTLPYGQAEGHMEALAAELAPNENGDVPIRPGVLSDGFFTHLLPAVVNIRRAQVRVQQRVGLLRCVEAVRLHAAANGGELPASLGELDVPVPVDPATGEPYHYSVQGDTAAIRNTPPKGKEGQAGYDIRYEVTVRK